MRRALSALALVCAACAVGPDPSAPELRAPDAYGTAAPEAGAADIWWEGFGDEALSALIVRGLDQNIDVEIAEARLAEAASLARAERSDLFPVLDAAADGTVIADLSEGTSEDTASGGFLFAWVPDIFGGRRRELQAARAAAQAAASDLGDTRRLIAAEIAETYLELRRTDARLALLDTSLDLQGRTLEIVEVRREAGLGSDLDVQRALADLAQTRAQRGPLTASRRSADTALAVLTARTPEGRLIAPDEAAAIPAFEAGPAIGVPADLLRQRPDIVRAEAQLVAATALIGAEVADLYPSLSLPGRLTADLDGGGIADTAIASISAVLDIPLFDAGRRRAEVRAARARADAALLAYERALLQALRDVEVSLTAIEAARARRDDLQVAIESSEAAFGQLQALYTEGLATLIEVLDAQRQLINSREAFVNSEAELSVAVVRLYRAAGTGLPPGPMENPR